MAADFHALGKIKNLIIFWWSVILNSNFKITYIYIMDRIVGDGPKGGAGFPLLSFRPEIGKPTLIPWGNFGQVTPPPPV